MHTEHDAPPVVAGNGDSPFFVAATLAALVLAGSALVYRKTFEQQPERDKLIHTSEQPTPDDMDTEKNQPLDRYVDEDGVSLTTHDPDSKESKSSRSKDRRRRGKDPLKEILKGGKKVKGATTTHAKQLFSRQPILDDLDNLNSIPSPSSPASSSTRDSTPDSLSRGSGKRTQPDDRLYNLTGTPPVGTMHSRPTSEVSKSNTGSQIPDQPHPHQHPRDRTASFTSVSDHHVSQSSSSSHIVIDDNTSILDERNTDFLVRQTRGTDPTPNTFSAMVQNNNDFSEIVNHSLPSSASSATTSGVITPATSPSLSYTSSKLVSHVGADSEFANNGSSSNCGPKNDSGFAPSHAYGTVTKTRKQKLSPSPTPSKPRSKSKAKVQSTWEWDNTGEVPPSSSSISASGIASASTSSLITAPAFPPDIVYRKPPRLQPKSLWSKSAKNDGSSSIPGSVSHPSLLSPTSGSFAPSDSALLSPSISSYLEKFPRRVSRAAKEGDGAESEEERDTTEDTYTQLEFPTLNPTSTTLAHIGGSTASSSAAGPSNRPTTPRRAHSSRGPSTPSGGTPPPGSGSAQPPSTPALSTQTQLASLRGALEAARLREEKHKAEMERYTKELESLRWENMNSKRGEIELQNHIRHLMHQLQMYSSLFTNVTPQPTSQQQPPQQSQGLMASSVGLSNSSDRATSGPESGNGPITSSPGTQQVQSPTAAVFPAPPGSSPRLHLHMLSPLHLNGLSSPSSMHTPSPYFPYPMPPLPSHSHSVMPSPHPLFAQQIHQQFLQFQQYQQHQSHIQNQSQSPTIQAQQGNPLSMLHQPSSSLANISSYQSYVTSSSSSMASGSRSSSRLGTESTGSSPDLNGSLSPGSGLKRKVRSRNQTANGYIGGRAVRKGTGDSWVVGGVGIDEGDEGESFREDEEQGGENGDGNEDDEGGFNEILADAILKRPDSIGVRSGKKNKHALLEGDKTNKDREMEQLEDNILDAIEPLTEFKFPSLSDLGDVYGGSHYRQSSSSSSSVIVSEDSGPNIFDLPALVDGSSLDIVHLEAVVLSQNGLEELDNCNNEFQATLKTASSSPESSERTPRREESEPNITEEPLMILNEAEEATNVP